MLQPPRSLLQYRDLTAESGRDGLRFGKFALVGASGYLVNLVLYATLVHGLGAPYLPSAALSFAAAVANNYVWNRLWTFPEHDGSIPGQAARFSLVSLVGLGLNLILLELFVRAGLDKVVAQALDAVRPDPAYTEAAERYADERWHGGRDPATGLFEPAAGEVPLLEQAAMVQLYADLALS